MTRYHSGQKRFDMAGGLPRLYLHEQNERLVRLALRGVTTLSVLLSVVTLDWYFALALSIGFVLVDWLLERTLFYYSSMYVSDMILDYDPNQWLGMAFISAGPPTDPRSNWMVGLWFEEEDYATRFFEHLAIWTGNGERAQGDLRLSFVIDEDMYYVFLYSDLMKKRFKDFANAVEKENHLSKFGKEHFPLIMAQIICKGFQTTKGFALGGFIEMNPDGRDFYLIPCIGSKATGARPLTTVQPIRMSHYKAKIPAELSPEELEYIHWRKIVKRTAVGADA